MAYTLRMNQLQSIPVLVFRNYLEIHSTIGVTRWNSIVRCTDSNRQLLVQWSAHERTRCLDAASGCVDGEQLWILALQQSIRNLWLIIVISGGDGRNLSSMQKILYLVQNRFFWIFSKKNWTFKYIPNSQTPSTFVTHCVLVILPNFLRWRIISHFANFLYCHFHVALRFTFIDTEVKSLKRTLRKTLRKILPTLARNER